MIERTIAREFIPDFRYYKLAENEFSKELLLRIRNTVSAVFLWERAVPDTIRETLNQVIGLIQEERPQEIKLFTLWIRHFFTGKPEYMEELSINSGLEINMFAETLKIRDKQIYRTGKKKGIEKGMQKALELTAVNLIREGMDVNKISSITGLSIEKIKSLHD